MSEMRSRVVFDCNVLLQAFASPDGPSGQCFAAVVAGRVILVVSPGILQEFAEVATRPSVARKLGITQAMVVQATSMLQRVAVVVEHAPKVYSVVDDDDDSMYVNVALAAGASVITSRDNDLLRLMDASTEVGRDFALRFPHLKVLTPVGLLAHLRG
ncbi:MAG TPA: putative toxin-antitoxin system toxin component, PIN family [Phycisphaerales bacterium]|nr:putative toxin-antitoxin system toxin component, PIN family [Phycisphaerales bacterium]